MADRRRVMSGMLAQHTRRADRRQSTTGGRGPGDRLGPDRESLPHASRPGGPGNHCRYVSVPTPVLPADETLIATGRDAVKLLLALACLGPAVVCPTAAAQPPKDAARARHAAPA